MTMLRPTIQSVTYGRQAFAVATRIYGNLRRQIARDMLVLVEPEQTAKPLVIAAVLGTLLSFIPIPFLDTLLVSLIFARFGQINRSALLVARLIWNDFVVMPLYVPGFRIAMRLLVPYVADGMAFTVQIGAFVLTVLILSLAASFISAILMLAFLTIMNRRHQSRKNW